jgi:hypothetical protein
MADSLKGKGIEESTAVIMKAGNHNLGNADSLEKLALELSSLSNRISKAVTKSK